jgi:alkanesulfonate monooxygenase SsuD/methylene tetrahydromethanopterin reductase-like flavin-dependent oxidoreductase (luciferase family)
MAGVNVIAADTDAEAEYLATSLYSAFLNVIKGTRKKLQPPVEDMSLIWNESERFAVMQMLNYTFIGSGKNVQHKLLEFAADTGVDELIVTSHIFDHEARVHSYELISELCLQHVTATS